MESLKYFKGSFLVVLAGAIAGYYIGGFEALFLVFVLSVMEVPLSFDLEEYRYLEHGAFYAIIALVIIMFLKTFVHIPEVVTGLIGAGFIALAFTHSLVIKNKTEPNI